MLGRIVKYFDTRKAVYQEINKVLDEIIKDDERIYFWAKQGVKNV